MIITDGPAQMIIAGPEAGGSWWAPQWLLHNDDPANEVYLDRTPNIHNGPGSPNFIIPPGAQITLTGHATFWARTRDGTTADLHLVPTSTYGSGGQPAVPAGLAGGAG